MYHFFYNLFASLFTLVGWNGMLIDSAAFVLDHLSKMVFLCFVYRNGLAVRSGVSSAGWVK